MIKLNTEDLSYTGVKFLTLIHIVRCLTLNSMVTPKVWYRVYNELYVSIEEKMLSLSFYS